MVESGRSEDWIVRGSEPRGGPAAHSVAGRAEAADWSDTEWFDTEWFDTECFDPGTFEGSQPSAQEKAHIQRLNAEAAANRRHAESDDADWGQWPSSVEDDPFLRLRAPRAEDLAAHENGPELAFRLAEVDPDAVDDYTAVEVVAAWSRLVSWAQAGAARAAADLAERDSVTIVPAAGPTSRARGRQVRPISAAAHEIAMRLVISRRGAQGLIDTGRAISGPLAPVGDALADGLIDLPPGPRVRGGSGPRRGSGPARGPGRGPAGGARAHGATGQDRHRSRPHQHRPAGSRPPAPGRA